MQMFKSPKESLGDLGAQSAAKLIAAATDVAVVVDGQGSGVGNRLESMGHAANDKCPLGRGSSPVHGTRDGRDKNVTHKKTDALEGVRS